MSCARRSSVVLGTVVLCFLPAATAGAAPAFTTTQVSLPRVDDPDGGGALGTDLTGDGRFATFLRQGRLYQRDLQKGVTRLVSVTLAGTPRSGTSKGGQQSQDGRYVAFTSNEPLVAGVPAGANSPYHAYVRDMADGTTTLVDRRADGSASAGTYVTSDVPTISGSGRRVVFVTDQKLVPSDNDAATGGMDVYVRDLVLGTTALVSVTSSGAQGEPVGRNSNSFTAQLSRDGRYVVFGSYARLVPGDPDVGYEFKEYERDLQTSTTRSLLTDAAGVPTRFSYAAEFFSVTADRGTVVFDTAEALLPADTNSEPDVYSYDRRTYALTLLSRARGGGAAGGYSTASGITPDGRYVTYTSSARDIVAGDIDDKDDGFVLDTRTGAVRTATLRPDGKHFVKPGGVGAPTDDGRSALIGTRAPLSQDDTNGEVDVYLRHPA